MKSTAKQEHNLNLKRNSYIPKMCVDPCPVGSTTEASPFKIIASFAAANMVLLGLDRANIVILHDERYSERQISDKPKFSKTAIHQAVARFKTFGSFQDLSRNGRPKVTNRRNDQMIKNVVAGPLTGGEVGIPAQPAKDCKGNPGSFRFSVFRGGTFLPQTGN